MTGKTLGRLVGSSNPLRASSAKAKQPPCHEPSPSPGENSSRTDDNTSSDRENVKREVMRPIPFAADQRTTVSVSLNPESKISIISSTTSGTFISSSCRQSALSSDIMEGRCASWLHSSTIFDAFRETVSPSDLVLPT
uniref:Tubulin-folding cofactor D n=1 Tax=Rhizophora mucronata TaxID=61149 RepID=A0A2P2K0P0_RHIMU